MSPQTRKNFGSSDLMNLVELVGSGALASLWCEFSGDVAYNTFKFLLEFIDAPAARIPLCHHFSFRATLIAASPASTSAFMMSSL